MLQTFNKQNIIYILYEGREEYILYLHQLSDHSGSLWKWPPH